MHLQYKPFEQSKLVFVIKGSIMDFFVDLRKSSKTFGQYGSVILNSSNRQFLYIKKGFAHGFKTLENNTTVMYKVSNYYSPKNEIYKGISYNFFKKKMGNIINKDIKINFLSSYDEILLVGSGKGVASVQTIRNIKWKRKNFKFYKILLNFYKKEVSKCPIYR